jgi:lipoate-protein ligase A
LIAATSWGLLPSISAAGDRQMAIDRWMLDQLLNAASPTALVRFYRWAGPCLSLGRHLQPMPLPMPWQATLPQVRRPTGGAAVLHGGDLCYAIALAQPPRGRRAAYNLINLWLRLAFAAAGQALSSGKQPQLVSGSDCFSRATVADLVGSEGEKRIGSAQLWQRGKLLQHGSIQLKPDAQLWRLLFAAEPPPPLGDSCNCSQLELSLIDLATNWLFATEPIQCNLPELPFAGAGTTASGRAATLSAIEVSDSPRG